MNATHVHGKRWVHLIHGAQYARDQGCRLRRRPPESRSLALVRSQKNMSTGF